MEICDDWELRDPAADAPGFCTGGLETLSMTKALSSSLRLYLDQYEIVITTSKGQERKCGEKKVDVQEMLFTYHAMPSLGFMAGKHCS